MKALLIIIALVSGPLALYVSAVLIDRLHSFFGLILSPALIAAAFWSMSKLQSFSNRFGLTLAGIFLAAHILVGLAFLSVVLHAHW